MMQRSPFFHRGPIKDQTYFFGRRRETEDILAAVRNGQCVSIVGPSHIGKTSLMFHVLDVEVVARHGLSQGEFTAVYIDCQLLSYDNQDAICKFVLAEIGDALVDWQPRMVEYVHGGDVSNLTLNRAVGDISRSGVKLILFLDEFEQITSNPQVDEKFFSGLRALPTQYDVVFVISSQVPLDKLPDIEGCSLTPNFFNSFQPLDLGLFSLEDAKSLIAGLSRRAHVPFSKRTTEFILDVAGLHPFFLQVACDHVFACRSRKVQLGASDYDTLRQRISGEFGGHFRYHWARLNPVQKSALIDLEAAQASSAYTEHLEELARQRLVVRRDQLYDYVSTSFKEFVHIQQEQQASLPPCQASGSLGYLIGRELGSVRIVERVGSGGMATVYKAFQSSLKRYVAVKVLARDVQREESMRRFQREAQAVAKLRHPNILWIYDFDQEEDLAYIVMDYVPDGTLAGLISGGLSLERALEIAIQIGDALHYAHEQGVIHRDVKPANILIDTDGRPLLTDFGLVKFVKASGSLTEAGVGMGTAAYVAPEQARGDIVDARSDVYALGVVLYEMVTGHLPFEAKDGVAVVLKKLHEPPPPPRQFNPSLSVELEQVILKAIAREPKDRYQSALEMVEALRSAIS